MDGGAGDIRHLPDVPPAPTAHAAPIRIELHLEELDPPVGVARGNDGPDVAFSGWLGLLEALSGLVASVPEPRRDRVPPPAGG